mmetsp:Transcript_30492/g.89207  ORF Transcript_30492/g.89207 Transcript_30492/m.89207 type:complete len:366 (-) Transcript_30492:325-1422(-)
MKQRIVGVAGGRNHTLAIAYSGQTFAWGRATSGQLGHGVTTAGTSRRIIDADATEPKQLVPFGGAPALPRFASVCAGEHSSAGLSEGGEVYTWGRVDNGRLGRPPNQQAEPRPIAQKLFGGARVAQIALGWRHVLARTHEGALFSWGNNSSGQLGMGERPDLNEPLLVEALAKECVTTIAAGAAHSLAATADGVLFSWGEGVSGQLGLGDSSCVRYPVGVEAMLDREPIVQIAAGYAHTAIVTSSGRLYTCGDDSYGQLGQAPPPALPSEHENPADGGAFGELLESAVALGGDESAADAPPAKGRAPSTSAEAAGPCAHAGQLRHTGKPSLEHQMLPRAADLPRDIRVAQVACGAWHTIVLLTHF